MPSHSPREGGWLALCLVTCVRRSHVCLSMSIYVLRSTSLSIFVYLCLRQPVTQSCALIVVALATSLTSYGVGQLVMTERHITS